MFAKIKKTKNCFTYNSLLAEEELELLKDFIGARISTLRLENANILLRPDLHISCLGRCCFQLQQTSLRASQINICFQSFFDEVKGPVVDQGALGIQKIITERLPAKKALLYPPHTIDASYSTNISYPSQSPIVQLSFYGCHEWVNIKDVDPDIDMDELKMHGFSVYPDLEIDSIEFVCIKHEDGSKTIVSLDSGGFWFNLLSNQSIDDLIQHSYIKVNGYEKNIIVQHVIG